MVKHRKKLKHVSPYTGTVKSLPTFSIIIPDDVAAVKLYEKLFSGSDYQKDKKGRPKQICSLPQKIQQWVENQAKKKSLISS